MRDQHNALVLQCSTDCLFENVVCDFRVYSAERVVQEVDVSVLVNSSREADPGLLATRDVDSSISDYGLLPICQLLHVRIETARLNRPIKALFIVNETESDILLNGPRKYEGFLLNVSDRASDCHVATDSLVFLHDAVEQGGLSRADFTTDHQQIPAPHIDVNVTDDSFVRRLNFELYLLALLNILGDSEAP